MATDRATAYAKAVVAVAASEGELEAFTNELHAVAAAVENSDELSATLTDAQIPAERRAQIIEDLLENKATRSTVSLVSMIVANGRARDLTTIAREVAAVGAAERGRDVAIVRSAVDLTDDQRARLATALESAVGSPVDVRVEIDPSVLGGLVAQVGDIVIDGSVRRRLDLLKQSV